MQTRIYIIQGEVFHRVPQFVEYTSLNFHVFIKKKMMCVIKTRKFIRKSIFYYFENYLDFNRIKKKQTIISIFMCASS